MDNETFGIVDGGGEAGSKEGVVIWHRVKGKAVDGEMKVGGGEAGCVPGVVGDGEGLVEAGGKGFKKGAVGCGGEGSVDNRESDCAFAIDKGLERNRKLGVGLLKDRGGDVREADPD